MAHFQPKKADELFQKANKKFGNKNAWLPHIWSTNTQNMEDAAQLYTQSAAQYKINKMYEKAADAYIKSAETHMSIHNQLEARIGWQEAAKCYRHFDEHKAIECYENVIQFDLDRDRFIQAAKMQHNIAQILKQENEINESIIAYEKAVEYYQIEHNKSGENKVLLIIAELSGSMRKCKKAAMIFENIAKDESECNDRVFRYKIKEILFKAALLRICDIYENDHVAKWNKMKVIQDEYCELSQMYSGSTESILVNDIIACLYRNDLNEIKNVFSAFDRIQPLNTWKMDILQYLLNKMKETEDENVIEILFGNEDENETELQSNPFKTELNQKDLENAPDLDLD